MDAKLSRVDIDTDIHFVVLGCGASSEGDMASMKSSHCWDKSQRLGGGTKSGSMVTDRRDGAEDADRGRRGRGGG